MMTRHENQMQITTAMCKKDQTCPASPRSIPEDFQKYTFLEHNIDVWNQHFLGDKMKESVFSKEILSEVKGTPSCPALCDPMGYTVLGFLQARIPEWVAFPLSRGSSPPRDGIQMSRIAGRFFTS